MNRSVLIVSPYFPPSTRAGVHRARHLAKHLPAAGWTPIVLCVDEASHEEKLDPSLAALVPSGTTIIKVSALPIGVTRPLGVGDISLRSWWQLSKRVIELLRTRPVSVVLITTSPYYPAMMSSMIRRRFNVPVVLDFQDPWVSSWGAEQRTWSKAGFSHRLASLLEPRAIRHADFITSVSEVQNEQMAARYPWLDPSRMAALPIGGDPEDFDHLRALTSANGTLIGHDGIVELSYVGSYWPAAEAPIRTFLRGVRRLQVAHPEVMKKLRLNFVGTDSSLSGERHQIRRIAEAEGVSDWVCEIPKRLLYLDALDVLARSNGLLLIGSDEPHYTASKIYPALMSGRPYLSLFHRESSAHRILSAAGGGIALAFSNAAELANLEIAIAEGLRTLALTPKALGKANSASYAPYEARAIARKYADIFINVSECSGISTSANLAI